MSGDDPNGERDGIELSRRTFTKAAGLAAGGGLLGGASGTAAAKSFDEIDFTNPRVQELAKVWKRGYRGRSDRSIGLTDSGIDARHPDLGPWNGVKVTEGENGIKLVDPSKMSYERTSESSFTRSTMVPPGTTAEGSETTVCTFTPVYPKDTVDAELSWTPEENDLEFRLDKRDQNGNWTEVARAATASNPEVLEQAPLEADVEHRFVAESFANAGSEATVTATTYELKELFTEDDVTVDDPFAYGPSNAKTIGWFDAGSRYGTLDKPRDPNGHGTHVASIMGGSGRASEIAREAHHEEFDGGRQVLAGNAIYRTLSVESGEAGVYVSAYGTNIEIEIVGPGGVVDSSTIGIDDTSEYDNNTASAPAEPGDSFIVKIRAASDKNTAAIAQGVNSVGEVKAYSAGTFAAPDATEGDRTANGSPALHSGVAPNAPLVGLQGLSGPTDALGEYGQRFTELFNLRTVNMSWGYIGGLPLGGLGAGLDGGVVENVRRMAEAGILTVAAAGNSATPANGNGAPAVADEAISVVATGPNDGIVSYSSGGLGGNDEDDGGQYMKPDVTAPGGSVTDLVEAAEADTRTDKFDEDTDPRDYTGKAGTSMASPFANGLAGLVGDAMEGEGLIDAPADADIRDVLRLKQVVLATASETAFTAAPYHRGKAPTYQQGGRDPYEGYGRVNPDAAIDAVTRDLTGGEDLAALAPSADPSSDSVNFGVKTIGTVGLDVPRDSRAVAGYVDAGRGTLDVIMSSSELEGEDASMASSGAQIDVFVYDVENPSGNGEPNIVAKGRIENGGTQGLTIDTKGGDLDIGVDETRRLMVVAKLVNVPGLVNGFDARTRVNFGGRFVPVELPAFDAVGGRKDSGDRFTAGALNRVQVTVDAMDVQNGEVRDRIPKEWGTPRDGFGDYEETIRKTDTHRIISLGSVDEDDLPVSKTYAINAPDANGSYTFGPARVGVTDQDETEDGVQTTDDEGNSAEFSNEEATFGGTDSNFVVGGTGFDGTSGSSDTVSSTTDSTTDTTSGGSTSDDGSTTDTVTDTVDGTL